MIYPVRGGKVRVGESAFEPLVLLTLYTEEDQTRVCMTVEEAKFVVESLNKSIKKIESGIAPVYGDKKMSEKISMKRDEQQYFILSLRRTGMEDYFYWCTEIGHTTNLDTAMKVNKQQADEYIKDELVMAVPVESAMIHSYAPRVVMNDERILSSWERFQ